MKLLDTKGFVSQGAFAFLEKAMRKPIAADEIVDAIAELIRFNTLVSVARAGTGHLGASLSIVELLAEIYFRSFTFDHAQKDAKDRDIFILSKGHAAPSVYATLAAKGSFPTVRLNSLRRWGGLEGHCDIVTPGIEANTGSLAMGLSKAAGYAIAKKRFKLGGSVIVVVGDGELQEGQCWEAFISAVSFCLDNLYIVVDANAVQTDQYTHSIVSYGALVETFSSLGFDVFEGKGTSAKQINRAFNTLKKRHGKPKLFYAHTIKGQGVSYMEHTKVLKKASDRYIWHNKVPNPDQLKTALTQVLGRAKKTLKSSGFSWSISNSLKQIPIAPMQSGIEGESLIAGFSNAVEKLAKRYRKIVVVDGDLEEDCGFIAFHKANPKRFFEMGIMEQHIVGTVCALSRLGYIPVVSSYAAFLTSRANEQIYNLATEHAKAIIVGNMAGVLPSTPGKSHQAFRDIACMKGIPGISMYQPVSAKDTANCLGRYFAGELGDLLYLRLSMATSRVEIPTPSKNLKVGQPQILRDGKDALIMGIGPVVLGECLVAAQQLEKKGINVSVWNHPWLTTFSKKSLTTLSGKDIPLLIIEDHYYKGGFGESLCANLASNGLNVERIKHLAMRSFPATAFREEGLKAFGLHYLNIVESTISLFK